MLTEEERLKKENGIKAIMSIAGLDTNNYVYIEKESTKEEENMIPLHELYRKQYQDILLEQLNLMRGDKK